MALVLVPLWASHLVKAYAWPSHAPAGSGALDSWFGGTPGYGFVGVVATLTYLWLPYMVLPVHAGFERLPESHLEASRRPARGWGPRRRSRAATLSKRTTQKVAWPMTVVARPGDRPNHGVTQFVMADCRATPAFDEIVVTTFRAGPGTPTLPIWIHNNLFRPNLAPVVNVVAVVLVLASLLPGWRSASEGRTPPGRGCDRAPPSPCPHGLDPARYR